MLLPDHLSPSGNTPSEFNPQPSALLPWTGTHSMKGTGTLPDGSAVGMPLPEQYALAPDVPVVRDPAFGTPRFVGSRSAYLSPPAPGATPEMVLRAFLEANGRVFTLHADDILAPEKAIKTRDVTTSRNGMRSLTWRQQHADLEIYGAHLALNLTHDGRIVNIQSRALHLDTMRFHDTVNLTAEQALEVARQELSDAKKDDSPGAGAHYAPPELAFPVKPLWYPLDMLSAVLAWDVRLERSGRGPPLARRMIVRADTGEIVEDLDMVWSLEPVSFHVFTDDSPSPSTPGPDHPTNGVPVEVDREWVVLPQATLSTNASPQGWIPAGANTLLGNNAQVYADWDDNDAPDAPAITGTAYRVFDYPLSFTSGTRADYVEAAQVQAFYVINLFHDRLWNLGFDEAAGNFQSDNFGRGGLQGDPLRVEVQNDYTARLNGLYGISAWYSGWGDGSIGRISINTSTTPPRKDGVFDAQVLIHEAAHGVSSRLIGNGFGLGTTQSRGIAEGWSDFFALALLAQAGDPPDGTYPFASYVAERFMQTQHLYFGIRRFPYSTDTNKAPQTLADIDPNQIEFPPDVPMDAYYASANADQIHNIGEVWGLMLWECRANLIARHGFETGNELIMQLVVDGMKLAPENPNFAEARDAILQADLINHGGANQADLWRGFAKRGLGYGAIVPGSVATAGIIESYAMPFDVRWTVMESTGDGDGYVEPGESGQIRVVLESFEMPLGNAVGEISRRNAEAQGFGITSSNCVFGTIAAGQSATGTPVIAFSVDPGFPGNSNAWFTLTVQSDQGTFEKSFAVLIGNPYDYPPEIEVVTVTPSMTNAVISWTTSIESEGRVDYGFTPDYLGGFVLSGDTDLTHTATINGLAQGSNHHFRITAIGINGQTNATEDLTFRARSYVYVRADSDATPERGTHDAPFASLQAAAAAARDTGDEVLVAAGTYTGIGTQGVLDLVGSAWDITIRGGYSPDFSTNNPALFPTVIDGQWERRGIRLDEGARLVLHGATITHGAGEWGGGVHVRMSNLSATDCIISDNASTNVLNDIGGGLYATLGSEVKLGSTVISNNVGRSGGGVYIVSGGTSLDCHNCAIIDNRSRTGGGMNIVLGASGSITGSFIFGNRAVTQGGGIMVSPFSDLLLTASTVSRNTVLDAQDPEITGGGGILVAGVSSKATLVARDTIIWDNASNYGNDLRTFVQSEVHALYSNIGDIYGNLTTGSNLISDDPMFADPGNGDLHLLYGSPCIDAGSPNAGAAVDMDGEARPSGAAMDIGADEFVDADGDNMADYWEMREYGDIVTTDGTEDTDGDGLDTFGEYMQQTDPHNPDTDGDGLTDGWEVTHGFDPRDRDMDGDGMWDGWEVLHGLDPFTDDAGLNPDGDAHDNLAEFMADTDPQDGNSVLQILNIGQQWGGTRLDWQGGRDSYQWLEICTDLTSNEWKIIFIVPPPTPLTNALIVFGEGARQFYRIRVNRE